MSEKTHYRKVFKSDHLGVADLEDLIDQKHPLVFTIKHVKQEIGAKVAGKKINANIAYFVEPIKPLVLNATNSKSVKGLCNGSPFVEDWAGVRVQLYIEPNAKLKGEVVGGVRVHPDPPRDIKPRLTPESRQWQSAVDAYKRDGNLDAVLSRATLSEQDKQKLIAQANELANVS
jgi:hypothetical protein